MAMQIMIDGVQRDMTPDEEAAFLASLPPPPEEPQGPTFLPLPTLDFWLAATQVGVFKTHVLTYARGLPDSTQEQKVFKESLLLYIEDANFYRREDPRIDMLAAVEGITPDQIDALWLWAQPQA